MHKKIVKQILIKGQITVSEKIWLKSVKYFFKQLKKNHKKIFSRALINVAPLIKIKQLTKKNKRSITKEFPYIVKHKNRLLLSLKSLLKSPRNKTEIKFYKKLVNEVLYATKNMGNIVNKKKSLYEYAFIQKKYFYYRWF